MKQKRKEREVNKKSNRTKRSKRIENACGDTPTAVSEFQTLAAAGILIDLVCPPDVHLGDTGSEQNVTAKIACGGAPTTAVS